MLFGDLNGKLDLLRIANISGWTRIDAGGFLARDL